MHSQEIAYNNLHRKMLKLPYHSPAAILHFDAAVCSIYNTVITRSGKLIASAHRTGCHLLVDGFDEFRSVHYTSFWI